MNRTLFQLRLLPRWISGLFLACLLFSHRCSPFVCAAEPELTSLVGETVGVALEIRDLRSLIRDTPTSEWFRRLSELPLIKRWQHGPEFTRWEAGQASFSALIEQPLDQFVADLFGESVVLAVSPSPSGSPKAVLISRATTEGAWDRVFTLWDQLEAHDVQTRSAFGQSFQIRRKKPNDQANRADIFTVKLGRTLAISEHEELIIEVIKRFKLIADDNAAKPLDELDLFRRAFSAVPANSTVRLFVNPRRWDGSFGKDAENAAWLRSLWQKVEWLSAGLEARDGLVFHAVVHHRTIDLPPVWQKFVQGSEAMSHQSDRLPADAVIAGEFRIAPELCRWILTLDQSENAKSDRQSFNKVTHGLLGRDLFDEVLSHAGPSIGGAIVPKKPVEERSSPVDGILAWEFGFSDGLPTREGQPSLRESLDGGLLTLLNLAAVAHNSRNSDKPAILNVRHQESLTIKWLDSLPPYRPAYGISPKHLLLASDPLLISAFHDDRARNSALSSEPLFASVRARYFSDHSHWLFVNSRAAREFLSEQREPLSKQLAHWRKVAPPSVAARLDQLQELLTPFDAAFFAAKVSQGEVRFTVGTVTTEPRR